MTISATTQGLRMGVATSTSRPAVPFDGQVISETDTDSLKVYNGTSWVGVGGLVPIVPTSVAVGSGTGSVGASGLITFSGVSSVSINGCFTSAYTNYRVVARYTNASTLTALYCRLRASGTNATTNYDTTGFRSFNNLAIESNGYNTDVQQYANSANVAGAYNGGIFDFFGPAEALSTNFISTHSATEAGTAGVNWFSAWYNDNQTSYDGFTITVAASTLSGTLMVYGYSK